MRKILVTSILAVSLSAIPALAQGSATIRDAQQALKDKGFDPGPVDGVDGPATRAAVKKYQAQQNITADGRLGPKTLDGLGVKQAESQTELSASGENVKKSYSKGGKTVAEGTKDAGTDLKHGEVGEGAVDFGKGVGKGVAKMGEGTGHAAKNVAKGVKNAVVPNDKKVTPDKDK
jgi:peptidoglycan hydrolase-like protein with peptidoglycan-binding domain